jgi:hypothetical protein
LRQQVAQNGAVTLVDGPHFGRIDPAAADHPVAGIEYCRLSWRDAVFGLAKRIVQSAPPPSEPSSVTGTGLASERTLAVRGPSGSGPMRLVSTIRAAPTASRLFGPTSTRRRRVDAGDIERLGLTADLQPAALADGIMDDALVRPQHRAGGGMDDLARRAAFGADLRTTLA